MADTHRFERFHEIVIDATGEQILDYVSNPNTWPEWIAASHEITAPNRPLAIGEIFRERWATRTGEATLNWTVTAREDGRLWEARTPTDFLGDIVVRYEIEPAPGGARGHLYRRRVINPARPKPPTDDMVRRIDEEAAVSLANIKRHVEARKARGATSG